MNKEEQKEYYKEYSKEYYQKNKEKIKENWKEYYKKNKDKIEKRMKKYREKNKDKIAKQTKEYKKEYNKNNKDKIIKHKKEHYENNKENILKQKKEYYEKQVDKENKRRKKLNLPLVGESYRNEMELLYYINNLFKNYEILTHNRKPLMSWKPLGLELDIYIPELKLAFEYMGEQHYRWVDYFHKTKKEFEYLKYKDKCKKKICKQKGITLIRIKYNEDLSEQLVLTKLKYLSIPVVKNNLIKLQGVSPFS